MATTKNRLKPQLRLTGEDGNAFFLLAKARRVALEAGWSEDEVLAMTNKAMCGDYNHLLLTLQQNFEVS